MWQKDSHVAEQINPSLTPETVVRQFALQKATAVAKRHDSGLVLGADTVVVHQNILLGKPESREAAVKILQCLSGNWHQVMTAVAIVDASGQKEPWVSVETTKVKFRSLTMAEIIAYVETGESMDKAGAYGIQGYGALLVEKIEGCYFNVVGLPLQKVAAGLRNWGINLYEYKHCLPNERVSGVCPSAGTDGDAGR